MFYRPLNFKALGDPGVLELLTHLKEKQKTELGTERLTLQEALE